MKSKLSWFMSVTAVATALGCVTEEASLTGDELGDEPGIEDSTPLDERAERPDEVAYAAVPAPPEVEPRLMYSWQYTSTERAFARKAWRRAVEQTWYARWLIHQLDAMPRTQRIAVWNGEEIFSGVWVDSVPRDYFGTYSDARFANVKDVYDTVWGKFADSLWKLKRHDCVVWAAAHVIVAPQVRLCDDFFDDMTYADVLDGANILVHEMSHHVWVSSPLRQVKDRHVNPIPPCTGPGNACYDRYDVFMLADNYPMHAVATPDNYSYFSEAVHEELQACCGID